MEVDVAVRVSIKRHKKEWRAQTLDVRHNRGKQSNQSVRRVTYFVNSLVAVGVEDGGSWKPIT